MNRCLTMAEFAANLKYDDLPEEVIQKAKMLIADQIACQLGFATMPWGKAAYRYVAAHHPVGGVSHIAYYGTQATPEDAAFVNSVFGHGFEMDDTEMTTTAHPGSCVIPTVFAVGEDVQATGKDVLTAMVAGYETFIRIGRCIRPADKNHWQGTPIPGGFGAAAAAGQLLGFDAELMKQAFAITTTLVSGNAEHMNSGGSSVHIMPGQSIQGAIRAAYLAEYGVTGPDEAFDGRLNLFEGVCGCEPFYEHLEIPFIDNWYIMNMGNKPYCCCAGTHALIDASLALREKIGNLDDIEQIEIIQQSLEHEVLSGIVHPTSVAESQFSARFECALALVKGDCGFHAFCEENVHDSKIHEVIDKMVMTGVPDGTLSDDLGSAKLVITLKDGTVLEDTQKYGLGTVHKPFEMKDITAKFLDLTKDVIPREKALHVIDVIMHLEDLADLTPLMRLLVSEA